MQQGSGPLSDDEKIVHLLNRFTPGATAGLVAEVKAQGWKAWFAKQLKGDLPESETYLSRVNPLETITCTPKEIFDKWHKPIPDDLPEKEKQERRRLEAIPQAELAAWVLARAVYSANAVREASADFFRNHFSVSIDKDEVRTCATDWEREVIRRHALGSFSEMLKASARHAAMLLYLDNHLSRRPPTPSELKMIESEARRRTKSKDRAKEAVDIAKQRGLNENYARELLELHTLGVDRFYAQSDVIEVAKCLTGWTVNRSDLKRFEFEFNVEMHATDNKTFLGGAVKGRRDTSEGDLVLEVLCRHKGTALFLAQKLLRHFVNDAVDEKMATRIAKVFLSTGGDLTKVYHAIVEDAEFFDRANFRAKFKRPFEFVVSALRVTGAEIASFGGIDQALAAMNEPLYRCADPTGYYDQAEAWGDAGAIAVRWTFAEDLVAGRVPGVKIPAAFYADLPSDPAACRNEVVRRILPVAGVGGRTAAKLETLAGPDPKRAAPRMVAVLLGSPEFQKQ